MDMRFKLTSKKPGAPGFVNMRMVPVEGAAENEEFLADPSGEIVLDGIREEMVTEMVVPEVVVTPGPKESEVRKFSFPHQEYIVTFTKA